MNPPDSVINATLRSVSHRFGGRPKREVMIELQRVLPGVYDPDNLEVVADNIHLGIIMGDDGEE